LHYYYYFYICFGVGASGGGGIGISGVGAAAFKLCYHPILPKILAINTYTIICNNCLARLCLKAPRSEGRMYIADISEDESKRNKLSDFDTRERVISLFTEVCDYRYGSNVKGIKMRTQNIHSQFW
jgi:hypothetical protein